MKIHIPRTSCLKVPKKGTDKENSEVAPSDQTEQTTEKNSVPSEPQAKQVSEQVGEQVETVTLDSVDKITEDDFNNPKRSIILPSLPQKLLTLIGKKSKSVLLKKNILDKNKEHHPDLSV